MIKKDYIDGEYRVIEYGNGTVVRQLISEGNASQDQIVVPPSPLEILKLENAELMMKSAITDMEIETVKNENAEMMFRLDNLEMGGML